MKKKSFLYKVSYCAVAPFILLGFTIKDTITEAIIPNIKVFIKVIIEVWE
jgi:hypothetical protein